MTTSPPSAPASTSKATTASEVAAAHAAEIAAGERFAFGKNWRAFLEGLTEARIADAVRSLQRMLGRESLSGSTFLDIGSGSGLFSLAAHRLGAAVTSFDYDSDSVWCTGELRRRFGGDGSDWRVLQGSAIDPAFVDSLGQFDVVYSWGVLHHTGAMWDAIWNTVARVRPGGTLFIAIYNDQGVWSRRWAAIKRFYCSGPLGRAIVSGTIIPYWVLRGLVSDLVWLRNPFQRYGRRAKERGMSVVRDWIDWLGGHPFEVATPEAIILPIQERGFRLTNLVTQRGTVGCVEYVFTRIGDRQIGG